MWKPSRIGIYYDKEGKIRYLACPEKCWYDKQGNIRKLNTDEIIGV